MMRETEPRFPGAAHPAFGGDSFGEAEPSTSSRKRPKRAGRSRPAKTPSSKGSNRRLSGILAIAFAVGVVALVGQGLSGQQTEEVWVLRASTQIRPWRDITADQFEAVQVPAELVEAGALQGTTQEAVLTAATSGESDVKVAGKRALYPILPGQQIRPQVMLTTGDLLAAPLGPDERLVSITIPVDRGVGGLLRSGDRVDVVRTSDVETRLIATDVEIVVVAPGEDELANIARSSGEKDPLSRIPDYPLPNIYVLRLPTLIAAEVLAAVEAGGVNLLYRPAGAVDPTPEAQTDVSQVEGSPSESPNDNGSAG